MHSDDVKGKGRSYPDLFRTRFVRVLIFVHDHSTPLTAIAVQISSIPNARKIGIHPKKPGPPVCGNDELKRTLTAQRIRA